MDSQLTISSHYRHNAMSDYNFFSRDPSWWGETFQSLWGCLDICPVLHQFHITSITYLELSSLTSLKAWRDAEKFHSDIAYLLVLTEKGAPKDRIYGLSTILVNHYQARVPTMEKVVKQLTTLVPMGPNLKTCLGRSETSIKHIVLCIKHTLWLTTTEMKDGP